MPDFYAWRYRWVSFYIDARRALLKMEDGNPDTREQERRWWRKWVAREYGERDVDGKFERWLHLDPPSLCIPGEYLALLHEVEDAFIRGASYPALTGACCLAERILNDLLLGLRADFVGSPRYKEVAGQDSFDDWQRVISILREWKILDDALVAHFRELLKLRAIGAVPYGDVTQRSQRAKTAVGELYAVVSRRFGIRTGPFFMCQGEIYVRRSSEPDPFVKTFILPHCHRLSYIHRVEGTLSNRVAKDDLPAATGELTDEEFCEYRRAWRDEGVDRGKERRS